MDFAPLQIGPLTARRAGLGSWALGGGWDWGETQEPDALAAVQAALDGGVNLIDTAPAYGDGRAESLLGRALKGRRHQVLLATKCGLRRSGAGYAHDLRPEAVYAQADASLQRLQTDYIDLYQVHWPDPQTPLCDTLGALLRLKEQGKIRAIGLCNIDQVQLQEACAVAPVACVQNPFSLLNPAQEAVRDMCLRRGVAFVAYGALGGGILSGKYTKEPNFRRRDARRYFYKYYFAEGFARARAVAARVKELAAQKGAPACAVALCWALGQRGVSCVLAGARNAAQARANAAAAQMTLTPQEKEYLLHG